MMGRRTAVDTDGRPYPRVGHGNHIDGRPYPRVVHGNHIDGHPAVEKNNI